ncbi:S-adenosyl-L-methionine-dependent methyltransferase [Gonapodya prolifera JEL478]|uniref:tRNA (cytosine(38)-C(5))-methyltransferase n=1 Tax=Gonapodya prolifera (strain JEL478) TaxID=1344416 RepID=A0A139APP4_GONPJ|nr:S-adenosyl-L-methionine-dependent methyltransferase [Gonapodya prolifera JEL478]|eukprot:KXS18465.1 S-adenosyl-L-methionine-dependent methyltransferase [Gonapodya prolifera JEL478]
MADVPIKALEFFCGIGGLHYSFEFSRVDGEVLAAFDISPQTNECYEYNFGVQPIQVGIDHLTVESIEKYGANAWFLSPPCQPYVRGGKHRDDQDPRARGLIHLVKLLPKMRNPPRFIFLENVFLFEQSKSRALLVEALDSLGYGIAEFMVSSIQFGVPNDRQRYYLTARLPVDEPSQPRPVDAIPYLDKFRIYTSWPPPPSPADIPETHFRTKVELGLNSSCKPTGLTSEGENSSSTGDSKSEDVDEQSFSTLKLSGFDLTHMKPVSTFLERFENPDDESPFLVPDNYLLKRHGFRFDIACPEDRKCSAFTKAYGTSYVVGTGAYLQTDKFDNEIDWQHPETLLPLRLRFFTPTEVARLHQFPIDSSVPTYPGDEDAYVPWTQERWLLARAQKEAAFEAHLSGKSEITQHRKRQKRTMMQTKGGKGAKEGANTIAPGSSGKDGPTAAVEIKPIAPPERSNGKISLHRFDFPPTMTLKHRWRALGNSLSVITVGTLMREVLFNVSETRFFENK